MKVTKISQIKVGFWSLILLGFMWSTGHAETIKIGIVGPFSGDLASYGIPMKHAAELAVRDINAKGGVMGKKLELLAEDDVCESNNATNVATKLVTEGVVAVVGHLCSGATEAALPVYAKAKVVVISPASTNPSLTLEGKNPNFFRTIAHDAVQAEVQVTLALNKLKAKKIAVIHDKTTYGKGIADLVMKRLHDAGIKEVLFEGITPGAVSYSALIHKIKKEGADTVMFGGYHPEASKIVMQARQKRVKAHFISGDGVKDPSLIKIARRHAEGYYVSAPTDVSQVPMAKQVTDSYHDTYTGNLGTFSLQSYAAVQAYANAVEAAKSTDFSKTTKSLRTSSVETPLGNIAFDERGDVVGTGFTMYRVNHGKFVAVQ